MYFPESNIIDNNNIKLYEELRMVLKDQRVIDIASGYFNIGGFELIQAELVKTSKCRILLGKAPEATFQERSDVFDYFKTSLRKEVEYEEFAKPKETATERLIDFLNKDDVQIRLYEKSFLHGKAYIFPKLVITGSSNFTYAGLTNNTELNAVLTEAHAIQVREQWFNRLWDEASDFKAQLIEILERSKYGTKTTPFEVFLKALYELQKEDVLDDGRSPEDQDIESKVNLAEFQADAVKRVLSRLEKYDGVLVADSVGLGKTWIAKRVIEEYGFYMRKNFLVVCPAQIRDRIWRNELKDLGLSENIISQEDIGNQDFEGKLARAIGGLDKLEKIALIVIDESHNFRNPVSNRYENLYSIIERATTDRNRPKILLLTATPINNGIWDLYFQLMLIARNNDKIFIRDNVPSLFDFFKGIDKEGDTERLDDILHEISVRRTRQYIQANYPDAEINGNKVKFPKRNLEQISYELDSTYKGLYRDIADKIENDLTMAYYRLEEYRVVGDKNMLELGRMMALDGIYRTILLKRLESSLGAFRSSVNNQISFLEKFKAYFNQGFILRKKYFNKFVALLSDGDDFDENTLEALEDFLEPIDPKQYDTERFMGDIDLDLDTYKEMLASVSPIKEKDDAKLNEFKRRLLYLKDEGKILIFTYYTDTLNYVFNALEQDKAFQKELGKKVEHICGQHAPGQRDKIVDRFLAGDTDILISTDVLSEGQNLQVAKTLINYDLHWNPTRMIQRAGRIDRIGSPFDKIHIYNFFPEDELEDLLRLVRRLQKKIEDINESIGLDASVLGEIINPKVFGALTTLAKGTDEEKQKLINDLEAMQFGGGEKFWEPLKRFINKKGTELLEELPDGIRSGLERGVRGVFYYFKYGDDYNLWYFYDIHSGEYVTNKSKILDLITCPEEEPRVIPSDIDIYEIYEKILAEIKTSFRDWQHQTALQASRRDEKLVRDIVDELDFLKEEILFQYTDEVTRVENIEEMLEKLEKIGFTKKRWQQLRKIWTNYKNRHRDWRQLEQELSEFLGDKKILQQEEFEEFEQDRLRLICVDIIS